MMVPRSIVLIFYLVSSTSSLGSYLQLSDYVHVKLQQLMSDKDKLLLIRENGDAETVKRPTNWQRGLAEAYFKTCLSENASSHAFDSPVQLYCARILESFLSDEALLLELPDNYVNALSMKLQRAMRDSKVFKRESLDDFNGTLSELDGKLSNGTVGASSNCSHVGFEIKAVEQAVRIR
jgi:hypothetical protein